MGLLIATIWADTLSLAMQTFLGGLISCIIGLFAGVLTAIFIVEKYLDYQNNLRDHELKLYKLNWQGYIHGGLSVLSALITHICLFTSFGKERYLQLQEATGDTTTVPNTLAGFIPWVIDNIELNHSTSNSDVYDLNSQNGMGKDKTKLFLNEFEKGNNIPLFYSDEDLLVLKSYLKTFNNQLHDQIFLLQPFLSQRMKLGANLIQLSRYINDLVEYLEFAHLSPNQIPQRNDAIISRTVCTIGINATQLITLIWQFEENEYREFRKTDDSIPN
jgi:hypothetical protein